MPALPKPVMKKLALIQLRLKETDKYVFQRRDGDAPTSSHLLGFFGGSMEPGELADEAAIRELKEETSLDVGSLTLAHIASLELPRGLHDRTEAIELHLFSTTIPDVNFAVYEGVGSETYNREDVLSRDDLAPTLRYLLEQTYPH